MSAPRQARSQLVLVVDRLPGALACARQMPAHATASAHADAVTLAIEVIRLPPMLFFDTPDVVYTPTPRLSAAALRLMRHAT
ncbi:MAG TPA: hypothetical protein VMD56_02470 [Steroidobacteraceae bacterium]|nr:hypothetical protein [Steroidobacteraceae bacterium]